MFNIVISLEKSNLRPTIDAFGLEEQHCILSRETSEALIAGLMKEMVQKHRRYKTDIILMVSRCSEIRFFRYQEILYIESVRNRLRIHLLRDTFEFYGTMQRIEKITENLGFIRVHHAFIISTEHMKACNSRFVTMDNEDVISIGKTYREHFRETIRRRCLRLP